MADKRKTKKRKDIPHHLADVSRQCDVESSSVVDYPDKQVEKPSKHEYAVAKWLKANVQTKRTKFLNHQVECFAGARAVDALLGSHFATGKSPLFTTRPEVIHFCNQMLVHKFFHRAKKVPVSEEELKGKSKKKEAEKITKNVEEKDADKNQGSACEGNDKDKEPKEEKKKRKIRLEMHLDQVFLDTMDAYVWIYDAMPWYYWVFGALLVLATVAICMFPLWPPSVRKGVYYLSVAAAGFLIFIIALAVLRLVVFCVVWVLTLSRHHIWLLPNLTEDVGFFASFWPLYKYEYRGPGSDSDKASKNKKKRKKEKLSDDENDDKSTTPAPVKTEPSNDAPDDPAPDLEPVDTAPSPELKLTEEEKKESESESENSQRSSTDRDFEMVDRADLDEAEQPLIEKNT